MSIIHFDAMPATSAPSLVVNLDGHFINDQTGFLTATAGIQSRADGSMWKREAGSYIQIDTVSDWISPKSSPFNPNDYQIRLNYTGTGPSSSPGINTWLLMGVTRSWTWTCNRFCVQASTVTIDIRHASDGSKNVVSSLQDAAPCMATSNQYFIVIEAT